MARASSLVTGDLSLTTICVLYGGCSREREVSLSSGRCILEAFQGAMLHSLSGAPKAAFGVEIQADGTWELKGERLSPGRALERLAQVDLFFLGLHGTDGEDGIIQGLLSSHAKRYTGSGVSGSAVCMDKEFTRCVVQAAGLRLARGLHFDERSWSAARQGKLAELRGWDVAGWVVKPRSEGSSVGISVLRDCAGLAAALDSAFAICSHVIVEELIEGIEVAAGVLEDQHAEPEPLPIVEICPKPGHFFDYDEKYSDSGAIEHCPPLNLGQAACEVLQLQACQAHTALFCLGYSRSDFIVPRSGSPVFLETNTLPGMTPRSLLPQAAAAAGLDFFELCQRIALAALRRPL